MTTLLKYVAEFEAKGVLHEFDCYNQDWLRARNNAIELAEMLKSINEHPQPYFGIKLYVEYSTENNGIQKHYIILGDSMQQQEILEALSIEYTILKAANVDFEVMTGFANGKNHNAVNQQYMKLCYFSR